MPTVLTTVGKQWIADKIDGTVSAVEPEYVASGTGSTAAAAGDTVIETEVESRVAGTNTQPSADTVRYVAQVTYTATRTIANAGTLTASSSGVLVVHGNFTGIAVNSGDKIEFTVDLQIT